MIQLLVNDLIEDSNKNQYRVLWIEENNKIAFLIGLEKNSLPFVKRVSELRQLIYDEEFKKIINSDYIKYATEEDLTDKERSIRDKAWECIKNIVYKEPDIYNKHMRGKMINELCEGNGYNKTTIYKYLRRYWQRGQSKNALIPDYENSGGKGKTKVSDKKLGRPRLNGVDGINIDNKIKDKMYAAYQKYYLNTSENSYKFCYEQFIKDNFVRDIYYKDGKKYVILDDKDKVPTIGQFKYWTKKKFTTKEKLLGRKGKIKFNKDYREVLGTSIQETMGPGSRFQIDATIGNIYLVNKYNRDWNVGRPVIYFVIDVYSRLITGLYVGSGYPSWTAAMMAIANVTQNKVEFCKQYGINITPEQWPSEHLPEVILADRGEMIGYNSDSVVNGLNVDIENTPAYRPDWKGIVEKLFDTSQSTIKPFLPGYVDKVYRERGEKDHRLKAKLTLEDFTKIMIHFVLHYNQNRYMKNYNRSEEMIADNVKPYPLDIWNWGIANKVGKLRTIPQELVMFYLMPRGKATVTKLGIKFKDKIRYSCETAVSQDWYTKAGENKSWRIDISYDPRNMNYIYIHTNDEKVFEKCYMLEGQEKFINKSLLDIEDLLKREKVNYQDEEHLILQKKIDFITEMESIVSKSVKESNELQDFNLNDKERVKEIKINKKAQKEVYGLKESFNPTIKKNSLADKTETDKTIDEPFERPSIRNLLRKNKEGK